MGMLQPNDTFIPALAQAFGSEKIIVVKDAMPDARIQRWYKKWQDPYGQPYKDPGDLYDILMTKVHTVVGDQPIASITFVWMQGESDATAAYYADMYEKNMYGLYAQLQQEFYRKDINWVIGRISDFDMRNHLFKRWTTIRDIQVKVAESNAHFTWVNTDDLNDDIVEPKRTKDTGLHYSAAGYQILGQRFANSAIALIKAHGE